MGYYTSYDLEVSTGSHKATEIIKAIEEVAAGYMLVAERYSDNAKEIEFYSEEPVKWYDCDSDMLDLSLKFPDATFLLKGEGESSGDIWQEMFHDGKTRYRQVEMIWPNWGEWNSYVINV